MQTKKSSGFKIDCKDYLCECNLPLRIRCIPSEPIQEDNTLEGAPESPGNPIYRRGFDMFILLGWPLPVLAFVYGDSNCYLLCQQIRRLYI